MAATIVTGDIWESFGHVDLFCFCSGVEFDAEREGIKMIGDFQKQILKKMPNIDVVLWTLIERFIDKTKMGQLDYRPFVGLVYAKNKKLHQTVGLFQTKGLSIDVSHPFIVASSFSELVKFTFMFVAAQAKPPTIVVDNPAGGSEALKISALFEYLPANITIYKKSIGSNSAP